MFRQQSAESAQVVAFETAFVTHVFAAHLRLFGFLVFGCPQQFFGFGMPLQIDFVQSRVVRQENDFARQLRLGFVAQNIVHFLQQLRVFCCQPSCKMTGENAPAPIFLDVRLVINSLNVEQMRR